MVIRDTVKATKESTKTYKTFEHMQFQATGNWLNPLQRSLRTRYRKSVVSWKHPSRIRKISKQDLMLTQFPS